MINQENLLGAAWGKAFHNLIPCGKRNRHKHPLDMYKFWTTCLLTQYFSIFFTVERIFWKNSTITLYCVASTLSSGPSKFVNHFGYTCTSTILLKYESSSSLCTISIACMLHCYIDNKNYKLLHSYYYYLCSGRGIYRFPTQYGCGRQWNKSGLMSRLGQEEVIVEQITLTLMDGFLFFTCRVCWSEIISGWISIGCNTPNPPWSEIMNSNMLTRYLYYKLSMHSCHMSVDTNWLKCSQNNALYM